ncbi:hypothetical protein J7400_18970 [Shimia sp. R9_2]|uniref:hypothetical protein n=1 Tax=Shimia sp. R9_2 TaxID=2821112 RepID=UPI001ADA8512|nr:hypothetical protein [Shimia sp. R9_2]MBO9398760.1 hypothetical protein [Shimia sp. R9_2]
MDSLEERVEALEAKLREQNVALVKLMYYIAEADTSVARMSIGVFKRDLTEIDEALKKLNDVHSGALDYIQELINE